MIDPVLAYSTYLGGSAVDFSTGIVVDSAGNAYVTGSTSSLDFPITPGAFQTTFHRPGGPAAAFVTKLNPTGTALVYSTYLGGSAGGASPTLTQGIQVDAAGTAYLVGATSASDFPTTPGAFQTTPGSGFAARLNSSGSALIYSTFLNANPLALALDNAGNVYLTGFASSTSFPTTPGAFQQTLGGVRNAFVTKLNSTGSGLVYSSFLGGHANDTGYGIAVDNSGQAYVTGDTGSTDFPVTADAFQKAPRASLKAFVTKMNSNGSALAYSSYLGGTTGDSARAISVDDSGNAYVAGQTGSQDFPVTSGAFQTGFGGFVDGFVTKLNSSGSALVYSTHIGGTGGDRADAVAVDTAGNAYVTGGTGSANFPTTSGALRRTLIGTSNAFVAKLNLTGSALIFSSYLGGGGADGAAGIAVDGANNAYVTGRTTSTNFPTTPDVIQPNQRGTQNVFVTRIDGIPSGSTATPTASATPTATATQIATATATASPTPSASPTVAETPTASPPATDTPTSAPTPTDTPTASPTATDTPAATPTVTDTPTPTPTVTETPTASPTATDTPAPTATSAPSGGGDGHGGGSGAAGGGGGGGGTVGVPGGSVALTPSEPSATPEANVIVANPAEVSTEIAGVSAPQPEAAGRPSMPDSPALSIGLIGADALVPGEVATVTLLLVNPGSIDASGPLTVQDTLPPGLSFADVATDGWSCASDDGQLVTCASANPLAGEAQTELQLVLTVDGDASGPLTNIATASSPTLDPAVPLPTTVDTLVVEDEGFAS